VARLGEQHERQQPGDLGVVRGELVQAPGQADGLRRQVAALQLRTARRGVALVEHQEQHAAHHREPGPGLVGCGGLEATPSCGDGLLGPADALGHGRLGHQERGGHLGGAEPAGGAEGERHLRRRGERRVTAPEQQRQLVVGRRRRQVVHVGRRRLVPRRLVDVLTAPTSGSSADLVGEPARRHRDQPRPRTRRHPLVGPLGGGGEQGLLHRVLARRHVAVAVDQHREDLGRQAPQQVLEALVAGHRPSGLRARRRCRRAAAAAPRPR
jgi:hypothetical protein